MGARKRKEKRLSYISRSKKKPKRAKKHTAIKRRRNTKPNTAHRSTLPVNDPPRPHRKSSSKRAPGSTTHKKPPVDHPPPTKPKNSHTNQHLNPHPPLPHPPTHRPALTLHANHPAHTHTEPAPRRWSPDDFLRYWCWWVDGLGLGLWLRLGL